MGAQFLCPLYCYEADLRYSNLPLSGLATGNVGNRPVERISEADYCSPDPAGHAADTRSVYLRDQRHDILSRSASGARIPRHRLWSCVYRRTPLQSVQFCSEHAVWNKTVTTPLSQDDSRHFSPTQRTP